eukprot:4583504-Prymnesium_polylepis.3
MKSQSNQSTQQQAPLKRRRPPQIPPQMVDDKLREPRGRQRHHRPVVNLHHGAALRVHDAELVPDPNLVEAGGRGHPLGLKVILVAPVT